MEEVRLISNAKILWGKKVRNGRQKENKEVN